MQQDRNTATVEPQGPAEQAQDPPEDRNHHQRGVRLLLQDLTQETVTLFRQEVALAKEEMSEKTETAVRNVTELAAGGAIAWAGMLVLLGAAVAGLFVALAEAGLLWIHALWVSPLIVGATVLIIGLALYGKGKATLKKESVVPEQTVETMKENKQWLKEEVT